MYYYWQNPCFLNAPKYKILMKRKKILCKPP